MESCEEEIGRVDHFYSHAHIAGIWLRSGKLRLGDLVHIKGHTTDFEETVQSLQIEHHDVREADRGAHVGIPVHEKVRAHDRVFIVHQ